MVRNVVLDDVYTAPADRPVLAVVDLRVALYGMLQRAQQLRDFDLIYLWEYFLNSVHLAVSPTLSSGKVYLIIVDDWRSGDNYNYWREDWLRENYPEGLVYKGNRGTTCEEDRPGSYNKLLKAAHSYCLGQGIPLLRQESFEADDFAGELWRIADGSYQTILISIDNDWGQLVDNKKDIIQYINGWFKVPISKLRSEHEIKLYYSERHGHLLDTTYGVVDYKVEYGDDGDNIEEGTPREVIDLRNPPVKPLPVDKGSLFKWQPSKAKAYTALDKIVKAEFRLLPS